MHRLFSQAKHLYDTKNAFCNPKGKSFQKLWPVMRGKSQPIEHELDANRFTEQHIQFTICIKHVICRLPSFLPTYHFLNQILSPFGTLMINLPSGFEIRNSSLRDSLGAYECSRTSRIYDIKRTIIMKSREGTPDLLEYLGKTL